MTSIKDAAEDFLARRGIAVTGVERVAAPHGGNAVYRRFRERGYQVYAVNPALAQVGDDPCYPSLRDIPETVEAVVMAGTPEASEATMRECVELGIKHVWMHRASGADAVSAAATAYGRQHGVTVIDGGCPLMFGATADLSHKIMRVVLTPTGKVPRTV